MAEPPRVLTTEAAQPPLDWTKPCDDPVDLTGYSSLTKKQAEELWGKDRATVRVCKFKHYIVTQFYGARDAALSGSK